MENILKKDTQEYLAKGENLSMAIALAQTKQITAEFRKLNSDIIKIKQVLIANYGEAALKNMNDDEK